MRPNRRPLVDGLQRCLCPNLHRPIPRSGAVPRFTSTSSIPTRCSSTETGGKLQILRLPVSGRDESFAKNQNFVKSRVLIKTPQSAPFPVLPHQRPRNPIEQLGRHLRTMPRPPTEKSLELIRKAFEDRSVAPTAANYERLMRHSSVETAFALLEDMKERGVKPDSNVYHQLLRILSGVFASTNLRNQVLGEMKEKWIELTPQGEEWALMGQIRQRETENVEARLQDWRQKGRKYGGVIWRMLIREEINAGNAKKAGEMLRMVEQECDRMGVGTKVWKAWGKGDRGAEEELWKRLLFDFLLLAARKRDVAETKWAYEYAIGDGKSIRAFQTDAGLRLDILNCAARNGDIELAKKVFNLQRTRSPIIYQHHWAALLEAYARAGDISAVFSTLHTMSGRTDISPGTITSISRLIPSLPARDLLKEKATSVLLVDRPITETVHLVFYALINEGHLTAALELHKSLPTLFPHLPRLPDTKIYNILLRGCASAGDRQSALELYEELSQREDVEMDAATFDALILGCFTAEAEDPNMWMTAFTYLELMKKHRLSPARATWVKVVFESALRGQMPVAWEALRDMKTAGWETGNLESYLEYMVVQRRIREGERLKEVVRKRREVEEKIGFVWDELRAGRAVGAGRELRTEVGL